MIGKLKGIIDEIDDEYLILDVHGVGYKVFCSSKVLSALENTKEEISLLIETIVREDAITLYGFSNKIEKKWFEILGKVNGIGNKMAMKIIGTLTSDEILIAIENEDTKMFCRAPGVGQKLASRIVVELKNVRKNFDIDVANIEYTTISSETHISKQDGKMKDAISALENLGYQKSIICNIVATIIKERDDIVIESLITEALKRINGF